MNRQEHLLTVLAEEGGEVAKEVCKALRFGLDDRLTRDPHGPRGTEGPTNRDKIEAEFMDLLGVYRMAVKEGILPDVGLDRLPSGRIRTMDEKAARVEAYMGYARRVDALSAIPKLSEMACFAGKSDHPFRVLVEGPKGFSHFADGRTIEGLVRGIQKSGREAFPPPMSDVMIASISEPMPVLMIHPDYPETDPPVVTLFPQDWNPDGYLVQWSDGTKDRARAEHLIPIFPPRALEALRETARLVGELTPEKRERYLEHARRLGVGPFPEDPNLVFPGGLAVEADGKVVTPAKGIQGHPHDPRVTHELGRPTVWQYRFDNWRRPTWELFDMPTPGDPVLRNAPVLARVQFDAGGIGAGLWSWQVFVHSRPEEMIGGIVTDGGKDPASVGRLAAMAELMRLAAREPDGQSSLNPIDVSPIPSKVMKDGRPLEWRAVVTPDARPAFNLVFRDEPAGGTPYALASVWPDDNSTCWHLQTFEFLPMTGTEKDAAAARAGVERVFLSGS